MSNPSWVIIDKGIIIKFYKSVIALGWCCNLFHSMNSQVLQSQEFKDFIVTKHISMYYAIFNVLHFLFHSETDRLDSGMIIEVWNKGMLWDKLIGLHWLPLRKVQFSNQVRHCLYYYVSHFNDERHIVFAQVVFLSVCASVCHKLCPTYNFQTLWKGTSQQL